MMDVQDAPRTHASLAIPSDEAPTRKPQPESARDRSFRRSELAPDDRYTSTRRDSEVPSSETTNEKTHFLA